MYDVLFIYIKDSSNLESHVADKDSRRDYFLLLCSRHVEKTSENKKRCERVVVGLLKSASKAIALV